MNTPPATAATSLAHAATHAATLAASNDLDARPRSIAIVGLGLLGGSVAMAIRRFDPAIRLIGCARRESTRAYAVDQNIVDVATDDSIAAAEQADVVVIATPVDRIAAEVIEIATAVEHVVLTDVGSTKATITLAVSKVPDASRRFVAAHPIAGSERTGIENARADLFENRPIVMTPSGCESVENVRRIESLWRSVGGNVITMTPQRHDELLAISSHMPHLMAALIAGQLPEQARPIVGTGWLDTTRIAAGDPKLWTAIVGENRAAIASALKNTRDDLNELIRQIENFEDEPIQRTLAKSQAIRRSVDAAAGRMR